MRITMLHGSFSCECRGAWWGSLWVPHKIQSQKEVFRDSNEETTMSKPAVRVWARLDLIAEIGSAKTLGTRISVVCLRFCYNVYTERLQNPQSCRFTYYNRSGNYRNMSYSHACLPHFFVTPTLALSHGTLASMCSNVCTNGQFWMDKNPSGETLAQ